MKQVLITGMTGFVGSNLKDYLSSEYNVKGVSRSTSDSEFMTYQELTVEELNDAHALIHLAGKAHDIKNVSNEQEYYTVNTDLTRTIFDKFMQSSCKTFIYMSSIKAVSDAPQFILDESTIPEPGTAYENQNYQPNNFNTKIQPTTHDSTFSDLV